ncbi:MAG: HAMP domain-containing histidine kinase [Bacteroidales bacterium]|nr:HAMP domain-containing histidine kinase [Bacteroidales bacterium]
MISLLLFSCQRSGTPVMVVKGVLDLRHIEQGDEFSVKMNGEWEFYFNKFLSTSQPGDGDSLKPDCYGSVPAYWSDYRIGGQKLPGFGFATYRAIVLLPSGYRDRLGIDMPVFDSSFEISINGVTAARNGTPGRTSAESIPAYEPLFFSYVPKSDTLDIIIKVSNFEHRRGGFWMPLKIGSFQAIQSNFTNQWFTSIAVTGMLFASFLFFFIFYLLDRRNTKLLMFSLLTLGLALRPFFSSPYLISILDVENWYMIVRGEYLILLLMVISGAWFSYFIYPTSGFRTVTLATSVVCFIFIILVMSSPVYVFAYSVFLIQLLALTIIIYALVMSLRGMLKGRWVDTVYFSAIAAMGFGTMADILLANGLEENQQVYILSFMMMVFVFLQSTLLIRDWVKSARERENLAHQLEELNRNLETRVDARTKELRDKSVELNARNEQIALQNKKLSETVELKNKIFSVISHDLRSPVVNILYTLNMIREEEHKDKTDALAASGIQYSQMVINLLENMLVWGRGQEDMIRYSPAANDMADVILTNMSILKESADRKEIALNFTQVGRSTGWFDRDLMDIVVRNLLSNAIKYTYHGGRVAIHLKEREDKHEGLIIKVSDNGTGMSEELQKKLFTGSYVPTTFGTDQEKGTGLGLKLVHELVTISRGTISVESTPGSGSCFTVSLPGNERVRKRDTR